MISEVEKERLREKIGACISMRDFIGALDAVSELAKDAAAESEALGAASSIYIEAGDIEGAKPFVSALLEKEPQSVYATFLKARIFFAEGKFLSARALLKTLTAREKLAPAYAEKIFNLLGQIARTLGFADDAAAYYEKAAASANDILLRALEQSNYLFSLHFLSLPQEEVYRAHCDYGALFQNVRPFLHRRLQKRRKIRVGYISPDLRRHVVLRFVEALFKYYDEERFEIYCYQNGPEDEESRRIMQMVNVWRNISPLSPLEAARRIYEDGVDILVDLAGHTSGTALCVLSYRPAPVQMSGIGYFATTGLSGVDYVIGDVFLDGAPAGVKKSPYFTEKLLVLEHTHLCYTPDDNAPSVGAAPFLTKGFVTFGSFNAFSKASDEVLCAWAKILQAMPKARLLLKSAVFSSEEGRIAAKERLQVAGVDLFRVELRPDTKDYLVEYHDVDIALDTFPYPGGATTIDALYMGVPVITLAQDSHGKRFGYSILANLGLEELAAQDITDYIKKALELAKDRQLLVALHEKLRPMMKASPLLDGAAYSRALSDAYEAALAAYDAKEPPKATEAARLAIELKRFVAAGDFRQAMGAADALLIAKKAPREVWRLAAGLYIDAKEGENAQKAALLYSEGQAADGYGLFLCARAAFLSGSWQKARQDAKKALTVGTLTQEEQVLAHNLIARVSCSMGEVKEALSAERAAFASAKTLKDKASAWSNYLFILHYKEHTPQFFFEAAKSYGKLFKALPLTKVTAKRRDKIKVGYISPDFDNHIVALFSFAFFTHFDKQRFEAYGYSLSGENAMAAELSAHASAWRYVGGLSTEEIATKIRKDEIDILFDLSGHSANNALPVLALCPAPVQISGIGYFDTTGLRTVDYFLTDRYLDPPKKNDAYFTERLLRLAESHLCYHASRAGVKTLIAPLPAKKQGFITFGCFNNFSKVTDEMLFLWAKILKTLPGARLFLKTAIFDTADGKAVAFRRLEKAGIDLKRVKTQGHTAEYLKAYGEVDIALDTYPYPGGGTTCDALYMGVPVVTRIGTRHGARFGASILANVGIGDICCANTDDEYVKKAIALAKDTKRLAVLRRTLRLVMEVSPLMDAASYMLHLEAAYEKIWIKRLGEDRKKVRTALVFQLKKAAKAAQEASDWQRFSTLGARLFALTEEGALLLHLGFCLLQLKDAARARAYLTLALEKLPKQKPEIYLLLAKAQKQLGDQLSARKSLQKAATLTEKTEKTRAFRYQLLIAEAHSAYLLGSSAEAADLYKKASELAEDISARTTAYSSYLLALHNTMISQEELFKAHQNYETLLAEIHPLPVRLLKTREKIRIGYLSPDFRQHVMFSFIYGLFVCFDRAHFEVYAYCCSKEIDGFTAAIREKATAWRDVAGLSYEEIADKIRKDEIDILVDLAGHSAGSVLPVMAYRPAPVQVAGLGYVNTTGLTSVDYFLTDDIVDPPGRGDVFFTEEPVCLTSQFLYTAKSDVPQPQGAPCKKKEYIVFGVFNHWYKVTEEMLFCWREILERVPKSRILIKCQEFFSPAMQKYVLECIAKAHIDIERVDLEPATSDYMQRYGAVDIALDTYPYPGGGTTADALYMGVPVITRYGKRRGSRFGLSLLKNIGLFELAALDVRSYIEKAVALAKDKELLDALHLTLRARLNASSVMQATRYIEELERFYRLAVEKKKKEQEAR